MSSVSSQFIRVLGVLVFGAVSAALARPPNILFILADDLGYGDIGPYGQTKIHTPNLDRFAKEGMRFTAHYSGHNVCAPSRCVLMTGLHPGHAYIRDNRGGVGPVGKEPEGQEPVPAGELTFPLTLKSLGYQVVGFGKWGLGAVGGAGDPRRQGFDRFFGYNDQWIAHTFYPPTLWDNDRRVKLRNPPLAAHQVFPADADPSKPENYARYSGQDYSPDVITEQALGFLREHRDQPFFLYYPSTIPHVSLQAPADALAEYEGAFPERPYLGDKGYLPQRTPRAAYAAMITRLDREIGRLLTALDTLGLRENTIVVFTSDNGPLFDSGGADTEFFNSTGGFRGRKGTYYEGGFRVPCLVRWPGRIAAGSTSDRVTGFEDWFPTFCELIGSADATPRGIDGISFAPTLLGRTQPARPFLYRESPGYDGQQAVRVGQWKAIRTNLHPRPQTKERNPKPLELYDLAADPAETRDLAAEHPEIVAQLTAIMRAQHVPTALWPIAALDGK